MSVLQTIKLQIDERGVAIVTLDRPEVHHAINAEMIAELTKVLAELEKNSAVRVVILASSGKSFCAGGDLAWMKAQTTKDRAGKMAESRALATMLATFNALSKPTIARVHGSAYGGGVGMMAVCDIVIAAESARFALTETKLGLIPATIGPFVVRRMGEGFARSVFMTAKSFDVDFALRSGLVTHTCAADVLDDHIEAEVTAALKCAPGAVAAAKFQCLGLGGQAQQELADAAAEMLADRWENDEAQQGISAFFDRQNAPWMN